MYCSCETCSVRRHVECNWKEQTQRTLSARIYWSFCGCDSDSIAFFVQFSKLLLTVLAVCAQEKYESGFCMSCLFCKMQRHTDTHTQTYTCTHTRKNKPTHNSQPIRMLHHGQGGNKCYLIGCCITNLLPLWQWGLDPCQPATVISGGRPKVTYRKVAFGSQLTHQSQFRFSKGCPSLPLKIPIIITQIRSPLSTSKSYFIFEKKGIFLFSQNYEANS